ncbi:MAG TPA: T9SS type A sorting domain-containing protein [Draconibacterium sp.]|nr:T9SS type A sorting domain-containing protein [Draconibacterium sp.]
MKKTILLFLALVLITEVVNSKEKWKKQITEIQPTVCYASKEVHRVFVPPSTEIVNMLKSGTEKKSNIIVTYSLFPDKAKQAFEYAVSLWELIIESPIPIYVQANWRTQAENVLGSCAPTDYYNNFEGAPHEDRFYPISAVEKITNKEITGSGTPDINADFNKNVEWYFGTDGNTPDSLYDFVSVVMHEMAHGLGFTGFFYVAGGAGTYGYINSGEASSFDELVIKKNGDRLLDTLLFPNPSDALMNAFTSNNLYADSPAGTLAGKGYTPSLYAPITWNDGSSIYHLNDATYPPGNPNSLMTHAVGKGEAVHDPGPITEGILADIGWENIYFKFTPVKDIEQIKPLTFNIEIKSDNELDTTSLFVVLSTDTFKTQPDTLFLLASEMQNTFTAEYLPTNGTKKIQYYINAGDKKNRVFRLPTKAPQEFYSVAIGPDNISPTIEHEPIAYYLLNGDDLKVTAIIDDNLGIDTAFVNYTINGVEKPAFGLTIESGTTYSGFFTFDKNALKDGDVISYSITARDSSVAQNTTRMPNKFTYDFNVEGIFSPVGGYINSFDYPTSDFIISDFKIYTPSGFDNAALQSSHPYLSTEDTRTNFNFTTILKRPIILQEGGTMSYDEIVLVEPGEALSKYGDENFWDYVIVEGSKNKGETWLPLVEGYDSGLYNTWKSKYNSYVVNQESKAIGTPDLYINHEFGLLDNGNFSAGDTILIRFRLFSDPYANGWGWAIDNLRIQYPVSTPLTVLSPGNISVFPNPFHETFNIMVQPKKPASNIQIDIFNMFGQKIKTTFLPNIVGRTKQEINMNDTGAGMYFITVKENGQQVYSKKIIKNN